MNLNGKEIKIPEVNFEFMCKLEDAGLNISDFGKKPLNTVRAFIAVSTNDFEGASKEIEEHLLNGGKLDELFAEISEAVQDSGFFQALGKTAPKEA